MGQLVGLGKLKNLNGLIGTQNLDLPACSMVSEPVIFCVRQRLLLFSGRDPNMDAAHIRVGLWRPSSGTYCHYSHPAFYVLYLRTLARAYTLWVHVTPLCYRMKKIIYILIYVYICQLKYMRI
jgi:hypothetical protein